MRAVFRPTRRNRNIGTARQGHGQNNRLTIPERWQTSNWSTELSGCQQITHTLSGRAIHFFIEPLRPGFQHACTIADVCVILGLLPAEDWEGLNNVIFRQPTRKQTILTPTWGQLRYDATISLTYGTELAEGPTVIFQATQGRTTLKWGKSLGPEASLELQRLEEDGHRVERTARFTLIHTTVASVRATQLYRTLPHEIGHWVDYQQKVLRPEAEPGGNFFDLQDLYFARPQSEREAFAHRYADAKRAQLMAAKAIPFERDEQAD
ncbi:hypothetical protein ACFSM5_05110 [Lacibacterium aquatile]|uniref:Tox-MPTase4 domain-containing protein n=1 Tax=Lacibacterium aquatile TaxID=1168082 RepID=A0ABW5DMN7_9PROT